LYRYKNGDKTNYYDSLTNKAIDMANYAKANMQVHQDLWLSGDTKVKKE
jgi:hypothetical protein